MGSFKVLLALAALYLVGAAPASASLGTTFLRLESGRVTRVAMPAEASRLAIYYGASWCGPCRAFVPDLIATYPRLRARGVEVLFISDDATCASALDYARTSRMPWLLLPCDRQRRTLLRALGGEALPGVVLVGKDGSVKRTSWTGAQATAPRRILAEVLN